MTQKKKKVCADFPFGGGNDTRMLRCDLGSLYVASHRGHRDGTACGLSDEERALFWTRARFGRKSFLITMD